MFRTKVVEKIKTHIFININFFFEKLTVYEVVKVKQSRYRPGVAQRVSGS
jgi:hypothetical protein